MDKTSKPAGAKPAKPIRKKQGAQFVVKAVASHSICELQERIDMLEKQNRELVQVEEYLRAQGEKLRLISDNLTGTALFTYVHEMNGRAYYEYIGLGMEAITGINAEDALGDMTKIHNVILPEYRTQLAQAEIQSQENLTRIEVEVSLRHAQTGKIRWALIRSTPYRQLNGSTYWYGAFIDVTERKQAEDALKVEKYYKDTLMDNVPAYIYFKDRESRFIGTNRAHAQALGLDDASQVVGKTDFDFFTEEHAKQAYEDEQEIIKTGKRINKEEKETRPNQPDTWVSTTKLPLRDINNKIIGTLGVSLDITERNQRQEALRENEALFSTIFNSSPIGMVITEYEDGKFLDVNDSFLRQFGYTRNELGGLTVNELNFWVDAEEPARLIKEIETYGNVRQFEVKLRSKSGIIGDYIMYLEVISFNGKKNLLGSIIDITDRKKMEVSLRDSEEKYRFMIESINDVAWQITPDLRFTYSSPVDERQRGYTPDEVVGRSIFDFMTPDSAAKVKTQAAARQAQNQSSTRLEPMSYEVEQIRKDGRHIWTSVDSNPLYDGEGRLLGFQGLTHDITERVQMERALRASEEKYRFMIENIKDVVWQVTPDLCFSYTSPAVKQQNGHTPDEVLGRSIFDFMTPNSAAEVKAQIAVRQAHQLAGARLEPMHYEVEQMHKDGRLIWADVISHPLYDGEGRLFGFQGLTHDITERKQVEIALMESEARNRGIVEAIPDLMFIQSRSGVYVDYHAANRQLLLSSPELILGRTTREVLPPEQVDVFQSKFDLAFETGEVQSHEYVFDVPAGSRYFESRMIAYSDDRLLSIVRDITDRKLAEQKLMVFEEIQRILLNATDTTSILLLDPTGIVLAINECGAKLIGKSPNEIIGIHARDLFPGELADSRARQFEEAHRTKAPVHFEDFREGVWFDNSMYPILNKNSEVTQVAVFARNITKRKQIEESLRESEQRYRALAEGSPDMIFVVDHDDRVVYVNGHVLRLFGLQVDAFIGQPRSQWFNQVDSERMRKNLEKVFESGKSLYVETETLISRKLVSLSTWLVPLKDQGGVVENVLGVSRDISQLKRLENSLIEINQQLEYSVDERTAELRESRDQLRILTHKIISAQEEERRRISRELHDEAGQTLIGLRFSLDAVYRELPADLENLRARMEKALSLTDQTLNRIRTMAYDLRPPTLDLIGLNLGVKELCREFSEQTGIKVEYSGIDLEGMEDEIGISLYRFVQEALTNVAKHAGAQKAHVVFGYQDEMIKVAVRDNGQGISATNTKSGIGLMGIKERIDILGGTMEISSLKPKGTQIQVRVPWKADS